MKYPHRQRLKQLHCYLKITTYTCQWLLSRDTTGDNKLLISVVRCWHSYGICLEQGANDLHMVQLMPL